MGAAVGAGYNEFKRAETILKENIDMIVVDTAHGHTQKVSEIIKFIKKKKNKKTALCAGNIATSQAAKFLLKLGVDIIKVGIGPGSICTTRLVAGIGVPQLSAILNVRSGIKNKKAPGDSKVDIYISFSYEGQSYEKQPVGLKSYLGGLPTLVNPTKATMFKYKIEGLGQDINFINKQLQDYKYKSLIQKIIALGGKIKFKI